jgi:hypothetical protein
MGGGGSLKVDAKDEVIEIKFAAAVLPIGIKDEGTVRVNGGSKGGG